MIQDIKGNKPKLYKTLNYVASAINILIGITLLLKAYVCIFEKSTISSYFTSFADIYINCVSLLSSKVLITCAIVQFTTIYKLRKSNIPCSNQVKITLISLIVLLVPYVIGVAVYLGL